MHEVTIRCERGEFLTLTLLGRTHPGAADFWDGNWVSVTVEVRAGGFHGSVAGDIRSDELAAFHDQFPQLQESLSGTAEFATMEGWLSIRAEGDGLGHVSFQCELRDEPGIGNTLDCVLATDQTFTRATLAELAVAIQAFPVVGK